MMNIETVIGTRLLVLTVITGLALGALAGHLHFALKKSCQAWIQSIFSKLWHSIHYNLIDITNLGTNFNKMLAEISTYQ